MHAKGLKTCLVIEQAVAKGHDAAATWLQHSVYLRKHLLRLHTTRIHASALLPQQTSISRTLYGISRLAMHDPYQPL